MLECNKPYFTYEQQLNLLKSRGLEVTDDTAALAYLGRLGYYRLSGYWYPYRKLLPLTEQQAKSLGPRRSDEFLPNARFQDVVALYVFDKKLRLLILDAIERIEVAFRVNIAYLLGERDPFAYTNPDLLHGHFTKKIDPRTKKTRYEEWISKHDQLIKRSKEDFIQHYKDKYNLRLPIWIAIELWDFGLLSVFYKGMTVKDKAIIASQYNIPNWQIMESWLRSLNYVRNVAAHHSRLWNRNLVDQPKLAKRGEMPSFDSFIGNAQTISRVYVVLCILSHYMKIICPRSTWQMRILKLIHSFPNSSHVNVHEMGFPGECFDLLIPEE